MLSRESWKEERRGNKDTSQIQPPVPSLRVYFRAETKSRCAAGASRDPRNIRDSLQERRMAAEPRPCPRHGSVRGLLAPLLVAEVGLAAGIAGGQAGLGVRRPLPAAVQGGGAALLVINGHLPCRREENAANTIKIRVWALRRKQTLK